MNIFSTFFSKYLVQHDSRKRDGFPFIYKYMRKMSWIYFIFIYITFMETRQPQIFQDLQENIKEIQQQIQT